MNSAYIAITKLLKEVCRMNIIVCLGKVAAGKSTRLEALRKKGVLDNFVIISLGQVLRNFERDDPELYNKIIKSYIEQGKLVSNEMVCDIIKTKIETYRKMGKDVILDGFPRNKKQAKFLVKNFKEDKIGMVVFNIADENVLERTSHRLYCPACGCSYSNKIKPPKVENTCDKCSGTLCKRNDDDYNIVKKRLISYKEETTPAIDWLIKQEKFLSIFLPQPASFTDETLSDSELEYFIHLF